MLRNTLGFVVASVLLVACEQAGASAADGSGSLSNELLEIWSSRGATSGASSSSSYDLNDFIREYGNTSTQAPSAGYTNPYGSTHTPNIDRLMSRYGSSSTFQGTSNSTSSASKGSNSGPILLGEKGGGGGGGGDEKDRGKDKDGDTRDCEHGYHNPGCGHDDGGNDCPPVPEPGTMLLLGAAAGAAGLKARRARAKAKRDAAI